MTALFSVLVPASNEASYVGTCLDALLKSDTPPCRVEVVVIANGCTDRTADIARGFVPLAEARGWSMQVLDLVEGGKLGALNAGDATASGTMRAYLDADVIVSAPLLAQLARTLDVASARYATGTARISPAKSAATRAYARFWQRLPFVKSGAPGFGLFAVNAAGRARWGDFPDIISDDTFVRLQFLPNERTQTPATYLWPMVEGFARLVRVRRRQNIGVAEVAQKYPDLMAREGKPAAPSPWSLLRADPVGFAVYGAVALAVKITSVRAGTEWTRGR
jgi:glycosyltransferase involved in cell wall biosynthesis